jgi:hypothetical protein
MVCLKRNQDQLRSEFSYRMYKYNSFCPIIHGAREVLAILYFVSGPNLHFLVLHSVLFSALQSKFTKPGFEGIG